MDDFQVKLQIWDTAGQERYIHEIYLANTGKGFDQWFVFSGIAQILTKDTGSDVLSWRSSSCSDV